MRTSTPSKQGYLAVPVPARDRPGPWPGVVVVHDALGLTDDMREQAEWLATAGFLTSVPDLYGGRGALRCVRGVFAQLKAGHGPAFDQVERARADLAAAPECTGTVGVLGYCLGGAFALLLAGRPGWAASSVNYGQVPDDAAEILAGACPVVASFGGKDRTLPGAADKHSAAAAGATVDIKEYPGAPHGFMNRLDVAPPLLSLLRVVGIGYAHAPAVDARRRIVSFFDSHLR